MEILYAYPIYDLSNPHFKLTEIVTNKGEIWKGQFVKFKVVKGFVEYLYPSEKYCFLPEMYSKKFWDAYDKADGEFRDLPSYIKLLSLNEIKSITIRPELVP